MKHIIIALLILSPSLKAEWSKTEFFEKYCHECHDEDVSKGDLDLTNLPVALNDPETYRKWVNVYDRIKDGDMPPAKKKKRPQSEEIQKVLKALGSSIVKEELKYQKSLGRSSVRRMTRLEYENTLRDLLHLPTLSVKTMFPADGTYEGYDKVGQALDISHVHMNTYLEAADKALRQATFHSPNPPQSTKKRHYPHAVGSAWVATRTFGAVPLVDGKLAPTYKIQKVGQAPSGYQVGVFDRKQHADTFVMLNRGGGVHGSGISFQKKFIKNTGFYNFSFSTWGLRWEKGKILPAVKGVVNVGGHREAWTENIRHYGDKEFVHTISVLVNKVPTFYFDAYSLKPTTYDFKLWLKPGDVVSFYANSLYAKGPANFQTLNGAMSYQGPGIALDWIEVAGPVNPVWPPKSHTFLWGDNPILDRNKAKVKPDEILGRYYVHSEDPEKSAQNLIKKFAEKAFRRPVANGEIDYFVSIFKSRIAKNEHFEAAMKEAYKAILTAPDFLFLGMETGDYKLASKLSYFIWGSAPDEELLQLASSGRLNSPKVLETQTNRLLNDPKAKRFIVDFTDQWLDLGDIDATSPDKLLYPDFDPWLRDSMLDETRSFFEDMVKSNKSVANIVDSDTLHINQRLAELYGIKDVYGNEIREVKIPEGIQRGGIITQASVMKVSANGTVTSPIVRGIWMSEKIMGVHVPPPPANVPAIDPNTEGVVTVREQLEKHREHASCAGCHAKMDPPGLALESYDVIGGFRDAYRASKKGKKAEGYVSSFGGNVKFKIGLPVDASGELKSGEKFDGIRDFRDILLSDKKQLKKNFLHHLLTYATGRKVSFADRRELYRLLNTEEYGVRDLIHHVVQSPLFKL